MKEGGVLLGILKGSFYPHYHILTLYMPFSSLCINKLHLFSDLACQDFALFVNQQYIFCRIIKLSIGVSVKYWLKSSRS